MIFEDKQNKNNNEGVNEQSRYNSQKEDDQNEDNEDKTEELELQYKDNNTDENSIEEDNSATRTQLFSRR